MTEKLRPGESPVGGLARLFWERVDVGAADDCWPWKLSTLKSGHGQWKYPSFMGWGARHTKPHRVAWLLTYGPVPPGFVLDHRCHDPAVCKLGDACPHRRCCNPTHLALVTRRENSARTTNAVVTHCPRGHPYAGTNLIVYPQRRGSGLNRMCRECKNLQKRIARWTR